LIVIGTEVVCSRVKALSGTCPPLGNAVVDCAGPDWSGDGGVVAEVAADAAVEDAVMAVLDGPSEALVADPPETPPATALVIPERI
jgi:hypothetical protein